MEKMISTTWKQLGVAEPLLDKLEENGIAEPTPIQAQALPILLSGRSLMAQSQTGTGKTLAYLLPVLQRIDASSNAVQAVVLSPTQELAMQIVRVAEAYGEPLGVRSLGLIGGASLKRQVERLKKHPQLVVGTPGRIHELLNMRKLKLGQTATVIVDEADQVFQLGSVKEVETILWATRKDRQLAFFSATRPPQMAGVESRWMKDAATVQVAPENVVSETIDHYYLISERRDKTDIVRRLVRLLNPRSALLFVNDTNNIANWEAKLSYEGFAVETLYGDADKQRRAATLARFRDGRCQLLLATDVAARGIDIESLPLVINIDPPVDADHYVHRAGRTGRMGKPGTVVSIVTTQERFIMDKFRKALHIELPEKAMYRGKLIDPAAAREGSRARFGTGRNGAVAGEARDGSGQAGAKLRNAGAKSGKTGGPAYGGTNAMETGSHAKSGSAGSQAIRVDGTKPEAASRQARTRSGASAAGEHAAGGSRSGRVPSAKAKAAREKNKKDKGAPKWLKAKRENAEKH